MYEWRKDLASIELIDCFLSDKVAKRLNDRFPQLVDTLKEKDQGYDMFINNAISMYAQTELLFEVWHRWSEIKEAHHIWNISTRVCEWDQDKHINGLTMRESMEYRNQKMALELAHVQLHSQASNIKMKLIRPGSVNTQSFSEPDSISAEQYVRQVLEQQDIV